MQTYGDGVECIACIIFLLYKSYVLFGLDINMWSMRKNFTQWAKAAHAYYFGSC